MPHKNATRESYQATAQAFATNVADLAPHYSINKFLSLLPANANIIDIGCGSGRDARIFSEKGLSVLGIDFSQNLLNIAKETAPLAEFQLMDIETATLPQTSFDGAWACCSLVHIPKKTLPIVLKNIHASLKDQGIFFLTLKNGVGEVLEKDKRYGDFEKFWSYYQEDELKKLVEAAGFKILDCAVVQKEVAYHTHPCVRLFCQK